MKHLVIIGATASGKSALAMDLAQRHDAEIVSCDSVQVYRGLDIGSAKASLNEQQLVKHHMIDLVDLEEDFDARMYAQKATEVLADLSERSRLAIVVGGTGLYLRALLSENWHELPKSESLRKELDLLSSEALWKELQEKNPERASELHPNDRFRVLRAVELLRLGVVSLTPQLKSSLRNNFYILALERERTLLHERIAERAQRMLEQGLIEEVEEGLKRGWPKQAKALQSIGYKQVIDFLDGRLSKFELTEKIIIATRQYAKRQETWFRKVERDFTWSGNNDRKRLDTWIAEHLPAL